MLFIECLYWVVFLFMVKILFLKNVIPNQWHLPNWSPRPQFSLLCTRP